MFHKIFIVIWVIWISCAVCTEKSNDVIKSSENNYMNCTQTICCPALCDNCGVSNGNFNNDMMCCSTIILASNKICGTHNPPCILMRSSFDTPPPENPTLLQNFLAFLTILNIVLLSIAFLILICFIYACCFFDSKKPPYDYKDIAWDLTKKQEY